MRPVSKGFSPIDSDFENYRDAKDFLLGRIGQFCSYCERRISTNLAVEHIIPKDGPHGDPGKAGEWNNFLLSCVNCNSTKGAKSVDLNVLIFPDRDNTSVAYVYNCDGSIDVNEQLTDPQKEMAYNTLTLVGLDKPVVYVKQGNEDVLKVDRVTQRIEVWGIAELSRNDLEESDFPALRRQIVQTALGHGFFSIWMQVFSDDQQMRKLLIESFSGTGDSGCFDSLADFVSPAPNPNGLDCGSKI